MFVRPRIIAHEYIKLFGNPSKYYRDTLLILLENHRVL